MTPLPPDALHSFAPEFAFPPTHSARDIHRKLQNRQLITAAQSDALLESASLSEELVKHQSKGLADKGAKLTMAARNAEIASVLAQQKAARTHGQRPLPTDSAEGGIVPPTDFRAHFLCPSSARDHTVAQVMSDCSAERGTVEPGRQGLFQSPSGTANTAGMADTADRAHPLRRSDEENIRPTDYWTASALADPGDADDDPLMPSAHMLMLGGGSGPHPSGGGGGASVCARPPSTD